MNMPEEGLSFRCKTLWYRHGPSYVSSLSSFHDVAVMKRKKLLHRCWVSSTGTLHEILSSSHLWKTHNHCHSVEAANSACQLSCSFLRPSHPPPTPEFVFGYHLHTHRNYHEMWIWTLENIVSLPGHTESGHCFSDSDVVERAPFSGCLDTSHWPREEERLPPPPPPIVPAASAAAEVVQQYQYHHQWHHTLSEGEAFCLVDYVVSSWWRPPPAAACHEVGKGKWWWLVEVGGSVAMGISRQNRNLKEHPSRQTGEFKR